MANQPQHIELASRIYKEEFKTSWRISGFNLMPFQDDHPVYGPWFMLGKNRASQWSVLVTKEIHGGVKNIGFKLVRGEEGALWDMVTFSLGLKFVDGRFLKCIEKQVVGRESNNYYSYLVQTVEADLKRKSDCPRPTAIEDLSNQLRSCEVRESSEMPECKNTKNCPVMNGSTVVVTRRFLQESNAGNGSTMEDGSIGERPSGVTNSNEADKEGRDAEIVSKPTAMEAENGTKSASGTSNGLTDGKEKSTEATEQVESFENKSTLEELFQQETITVVCEMEYTYMMADPVPEKDHENDQEDLIVNFGDLFTSGKFSDITLKCGNANLPCHKAVLYTRSSLFHEYLNNIDSPSDALGTDSTAGSSSVSVQASGTDFPQQLLAINVDFELSLLKAVLRYMYTNELVEEFGQSEEDYWKLYKAAGVFGVAGLRTACLEVLEEMDDCHVDDSNDLSEKLSVLSIDSSDQKLSVDVLPPVTNTSTQTSVTN